MTVRKGNQNIVRKGRQLFNPNRHGRTSSQGRENALGKQGGAKTRAQRRSMMRGLER